MDDTVMVVYARPEVQRLKYLPYRPGMRVIDAIEQSGILAEFAEIDLARNPVGIFGRRCSLERPLHPGDRVEIYRPLAIDPKEARRRRAGRD